MLDMVIHEKVLAEFKKRGYDVFSGTPGDMKEWNDLFTTQMHAGIGIGLGGPVSQNHASFYRILNVLKETGGYKETIQAAKRVLHAGEEYAIFHLRIEGQNYDGRPLSEAWPQRGVYFMPVWEKVYDGLKNKWVESDQVVSSNPVFEYPFKNERTQIETLDGKKKPALELFTPETKCHVIANNKQKLAVSQDDWLKLDRKQISEKYDKPATQTALNDLVAAITQAQRLVGDNPHVGKA